MSAATFVRNAHGQRRPQVRPFRAEFLRFSGSLTPGLPLVGPHLPPLGVPLPHSVPEPGGGCPQTSKAKPGSRPLPWPWLFQGSVVAPWSVAGSHPLDRSPGALHKPVPHRPEQGLLPGWHAGPPGGAGPEDHRRHHRLPGLLQGLPGHEVSPGTPTPCS